MIITIVHARYIYYNFAKDMLSNDFLNAQF